MKADDLNKLLKCAAGIYCRRTCPNLCNYMDVECQECEKRSVFMSDTIDAHKYEISTARHSIRETFMH